MVAYPLECPARTERDNLVPIARLGGVEAEVIQAYPHGPEEMSMGDLRLRTESQANCIIFECWVRTSAVAGGASIPTQTLLEPNR